MAELEKPSLSSDYDVLRGFIIDNQPENEGMTLREFRRDYIDRNSLVEYFHLLVAVMRDDSDIRFMDQKLSEMSK